MGLALSQDERYLFVANSNFDRRYGWGSVQAYDLDLLTAQLNTECRGSTSSGENCTDTGSDECTSTFDCELEPIDVLHSEVLIGSIARTMVLSSTGDRLYVPSHADGDITHVDVDGQGNLSCGGDRECDDRFREVDVSDARDISYPLDPVAMTTAPVTDLTGSDCGDEACPTAGEALVVVHRSGVASLLIDQGGEGERPLLVDVVEDLPSALTGVQYDPARRTFWLTSATSSSVTSKTLHRLGVYADDPFEHSFLYDIGDVPIRGVGGTRNTWAVGIASASSLADQPVVIAQGPDTLLRLDLSEDEAEAQAVTLTEIGAGASRMALGTLTDSQGAELELALISCFDSRSLYVVDVANGAVLSIVPGFNGPFEVALDVSRQQAYVADFRASVIRIIDLSPVLSRNGARAMGTLGDPQAPEEFQ